jgi:hypothetical protein
MTVFAIKNKAALLVVPSEAGQAAFNGGNRKRAGRRRGVRRCTVGNIKADQVWCWG